MIGTIQRRYKSREEAIGDHQKNYRSQGWEKGKFKPDGPDSIRIRRILDPIPDGSVVLDIGCNDGSLGFLLQKKGAIVYGVDVVEELIELASQKGVLAKVCPVEELDFADDFFDHVNMAETLEHCYDPQDAMKQATRVLSPEGAFTGSVPHEEGNLGKKHHNGGDYHQSLFSNERLSSILHQYFHEVQIIGTPYNPKWCAENGVDPETYQWNNWICKKKK